MEDHIPVFGHADNDLGSEKAKRPILGGNLAGYDFTIGRVTYCGHVTSSACLNVVPMPPAVSAYFTTSLSAGALARLIRLTKRHMLVPYHLPFSFVCSYSYPRRTKTNRGLNPDGTEIKPIGDRWVPADKDFSEGRAFISGLVLSPLPLSCIFTCISNEL
jgi:hypothetical protein